MAAGLRLPTLLLAGLLALSACSHGGTFGIEPSGQATVNLARTALRSGSPDLALNVSRDILTKQPHNVDALVVRGDALTSLGRTGEAADSYRTALSIDPNSAEAAIGLGRITLASDAPAAETLFLQALQHDPRNPVALNDLGIARDLQGHHAEAQTAYRQAIALAPSMQAAQVNLALSMALSGQAKQGEILLQPILTDPSATPRMRQIMAAVAAMANDHATAEALMKADMTPDQVRDALAAYDLLRQPAPQ